MSIWDYDKIKDMEYDPDRERYVGADGSELKVTPYSNGSGYKYDYYDRSTYGNTQHNSTHVKADIDGSWERTDNNRDTGTQEKSSGPDCYLTTACMVHKSETFDDNCYELTILRWFRDNFVTAEDIKHYYQTVPIIVEAINNQSNCVDIYQSIYENVIAYCVKLIECGNYELAYTTYKNSILSLEETYARPALNQRLVRALKQKDSEVPL